MATELAVAYISLVPSFAGGTAKIERELGGIGDGAGKRAGKGFSAAFGKAASLAVPLLAGAAILGQVKDVFAAASESRKIAALTAQVIKTTGGAAKITADQVADLSGALARKTGVDDEVIQSGANLLLTFSKVRNEAGKGNDVFNRATGLANDMAVALGTDMESASLQLGKALNDPVKGITALTRAGVSFTQEQKDQVKAMVASGDVLGAQKLILEEVGAQFGGAAEAAASPMDKLKVVVGDLQEKLGDKLLPVVDKVATWLGDHLPSMVVRAGAIFTDLRDRLAPVVGFLGDMLDVGRKVAGFVVDELVPRVSEAVGKLTAGFGGGDGTGLFGGLGDGARKVYDFVTEVAIPGIRDAVGSFLSGLKGTGGEGSFFTDLAEGAMGAFRVFREDVLPVLQKVASFIGDHLKPILIGLGLLFAPGAALIAGFIFAYQKSELFRDVIANVFKVVKAIVTNAVDVIAATISFLAPIVAGIARFFLEVLWPAVRDAFGFVVGAVRSAWEFIRPILDFIGTVITTVVVPAFNFLKAVVVDFVFPLIVAVITDAWAKIRPIFGFIVDLFNATLKPAFTVLGDVVSFVFGVISGAVSSAWETIRPVFETVISFISEKLSPIWSGLVDAVAAAWDMVPGIIGAALAAVGDVIAKFLRGAASIAEGLGLGDIAAVLSAGADSADGWGEVKTGPARGKGGLMRAGGGIIPGTGNRDTVPVMATPGEFMMRRSAVDQFGAGFFASLNAGRMPSGAGAGGQTIQVTTVANANADEVVQAINAKLGWAHTTRRDR